MFWPPGKIPVSRHGVQMKRIENRDEGASLRMDSLEGAMEGIAVIERKNGARAFCPDLRQECGDARISTQLDKLRP